MNKLHVRYLLIALVACALTAFLFQILISTILIPSMQDGLAGAAFIAGWWGNLAATFTVAILAGRKAAAPFFEPRMGKIAGTGVGVWVGIGAFAGNVLTTALFAALNRAAVRPGLVIVFGVISLFVALVTATITGRESAQPQPEEEA